VRLLFARFIKGTTVLRDLDALRAQHSRRCILYSCFFGWRKNVTKKIGMNNHWARLHKTYVYYWRFGLFEQMAQSDPFLHQSPIVSSPSISPKDDAVVVSSSLWYLRTVFFYNLFLKAKWIDTNILDTVDIAVGILA